MRISDWSSDVCSSDLGIVFVARFLPVARTMVSLPAGMVRMNQVKFLIWTVACSTIWVSALAGAGSWFGRRFADLDQFVGPIALIAIGSLVLIYLCRVVTWKAKSRPDLLRPLRSEDRRVGKCVGIACSTRGIGANYKKKKKLT